VPVVGLGIDEMSATTGGTRHKPRAPVRERHHQETVKHTERVWLDSNQPEANARDEYRQAAGGITQALVRAARGSAL
jgi:hypothetical protein